MLIVDDDMKKIAEYSQQILNAPIEKSESVLSGTADSFEDDLLSFHDFPDEYFDFALTLLSEEGFFARPGVWNFLLVLSTEKGKLSDVHYAQLADTVSQHYRSYANKDLCLAVCDFVARNYPHDRARELLEQLKRIEKEKPEELRGFADDGLQILEREIERSQKSLH